LLHASYGLPNILPIFNILFAINHITKDEMRTNTYNATTGVVAISQDRAAAIAETQQHYPLRNRRGQVQRDNPQREVEQIAAEPEAVPHVPEVQLPEARAAVWRQIRHYINRCLNIVYFNVGVI
jgi:hypothetical protein